MAISMEHTPFLVFYKELVISKYASPLTVWESRRVLYYISNLALVFLIASSLLLFFYGSNVVVYFPLEVALYQGDRELLR